EIAPKARGPSRLAPASGWVGSGRRAPWRGPPGLSTNVGAVGALPARLSTLVNTQASIPVNTRAESKPSRWFRNDRPQDLRPIAWTYPIEVNHIGIRVRPGSGFSGVGAVDRPGTARRMRKVGRKK